MPSYMEALQNTVYVENRRRKPAVCICLFILNVSVPDTLRDGKIGSPEGHKAPPALPAVAAGRVNLTA